MINKETVSRDGSITVFYTFEGGDIKLIITLKFYDNVFLIIGLTTWTFIEF